MTDYSGCDHQGAAHIHAAGPYVSGREQVASAEWNDKDQEHDEPVLRRRLLRYPYCEVAKRRRPSVRVELDDPSPKRSCHDRRLGCSRSRDAPGGHRVGARPTQPPRSDGH